MTILNWISLRIAIAIGCLLAVVVTNLSLSDLTHGATKEVKVPTSQQSATDSKTDFSVFDLVTECDVLAAHPDDPQRMADGVADDDIVPRLAIMACEDAAASDPDDPRHAFQLGRAFLAMGQKEKARHQFERAASAGSAAAEAYVGDLYQFGYGVTQDNKKALEHYRKAAAGEFKLAETQIEQLTFDPSQYAGLTIGSIYAGDLERISKQTERPLRSYLHNFVLAIMEECRVALTPKSIANFYLYYLPTDETSEAENIGVAVQTHVGEYDAEVFLRRHGCEGPVAKQLFGNLNKLFGAM